MATRKRVVDLLMVDDKTNYVNVYVHQIFEAISSFSLAPSLGRSSLLDTEGDKHNISCHKSLFLVDGVTQMPLYYIKQWVDSLVDAKGNAPEYLVIIQGTIGEHTYGISRANLICVDDLKDVDQWWPRVITFVYKLDETELSVCCEIKHPDLTTPCEIETLFRQGKECLRKVGVTMETEEAQSAVMYTFVAHDFDKQSRSLGLIRHAEASRRRMHYVVAAADCKLHADLHFNNVTTFTPVDMLKSILFVLLDLKMINHIQKPLLRRIGQPGFCQYLSHLSIRFLMKVLAIVVALINLPLNIVNFIPAILYFFGIIREETWDFVFFLCFYISIPIFVILMAVAITTTLLPHWMMFFGWLGPIYTSLAAAISKILLKECTGTDLTAITLLKAPVILWKSKK